MKSKNITIHRFATRDDKYWKMLSQMTPVEKILWVDRTAAAIKELRKRQNREEYQNAAKPPFDTSS